MTIEIDENSYIVGMWFSSNAESLNDWLCCIVRDPDDPTRFKGWSRFRYANGDHPWVNKDRKSWTTFTSQAHQTEDDMISFAKDAQKRIEAGFPIKDQIIIKGDVKKMMRLSVNKDWMHMKEAKL